MSIFGKWFRLSVHFSVFLLFSKGMKVHLGVQRCGLFIKFPFPSVSKSKRLNWMPLKIPSSFQINQILIKHYKNGQLSQPIDNGKQGIQGKKGRTAP